MPSTLGTVASHYTTPFEFSDIEIDKTIVYPEDEITFTIKGKTSAGRTPPTLYYNLMQWRTGMNYRQQSQLGYDLFQDKIYSAAFTLNSSGEYVFTKQIADIGTIEVFERFAGSTVGIFVGNKSIVSYDEYNIVKYAETPTLATLTMPTFEAVPFGQAILYVTAGGSNRQHVMNVSLPTTLTTNLTTNRLIRYTVTFQTGSGWTSTTNSAYVVDASSSEILSFPIDNKYLKISRSGTAIKCYLQMYSGAPGSLKSRATFQLFAETDASFNARLLSNA